MPAKLAVVTGKGGVGKTTVAAALALRGAQAGQRVGLAGLAGNRDLERAIRVGWGAPPATLTLIELDPRRLVDEVVGRLLPIPGLAQLLAGHPAYDAVYHIAPGIKELAVLHKLLQLTEGPYDKLVVDGLATGHGTHLLEAPRRSTGLLVGTLAERARVLDEALTDPARTSVVAVTTLEEMPVRETADLVARLGAGGFPVAAVVANRVVERLFPSPGTLAALEALARREQAAQVGSHVGASWTAVRRMALAGAHLERQAREMERHLAALRGAWAPLVRVPFLPHEEGRLRDVARALGEVVA